MTHYPNKEAGARHKLVDEIAAGFVSKKVNSGQEPRPQVSDRVVMCSRKACGCLLSDETGSGCDLKK